MFYVCIRLNVEKELSLRKAEVESLKVTHRRVRADSLDLSSSSQSASPQSSSPRVPATSSGATGAGAIKSKAEANPPKTVLPSAGPTVHASGIPAPSVVSPTVENRLSSKSRKDAPTKVSPAPVVGKTTIGTLGAPGGLPSPVEPTVHDLSLREKDINPVTTTSDDGLPQYSAADVAAALAESSLPTPSLGMHMGGLAMSTPALSTFPGSGPLSFGNTSAVSNMAAIAAAMSVQQHGLLNHQLAYQLMLQQQQEEVHSSQIVSSLGLDARDSEPPLMRESMRPKVSSHSRAHDVDRHSVSDSVPKTSTLSASAPPFQSSSALARDIRDELTTTLPLQQMAWMSQVAALQRQGITSGLGVPPLSLTDIPRIVSAPVVYAATAGSMPALSRHAPPLMPTDTLVRGIGLLLYIQECTGFFSRCGRWGILKLQLRFVPHKLNGM